MGGNEDRVWTVRANFWTGWRAVGGRLTLGSDYLGFEPHGLDRMLGGQGFRTSLGNIVSVDADRRGGVPRRRMFVSLQDGTEAAFLVPKVNDRTADIRDAIAKNST